ncbi:LuxR C-terminal-related transcriptional regulator [Rhizohabitans arisaemae]|uniref:LuxR C-terminal-related transcriptional regulator n=1 Tax=Rhizohabitans arisaemae TaxID=2720610 RepID=UPI0024B230B5|nr:LuxR C-terminal-related transcriptional regulator [Rhizohabitans arisaemae]
MAANNLPLEPNAFVGRGPDVDELLQLVTVSRMVTLCGTGGIGKSRLALRVATRLTEGFPDGVWLVELAGLTGTDSVTAQLAAVLHIREEGTRPLVETVVDALDDRHLLIVLDNCESMIDESARLGITLLTRCPRVWILTTSREPLRVPGETVWRVPPLETSEDLTPSRLLRSEAVRLFAARAAAARPDFEVTAENVVEVAGLCRALDGMPLAIELAAPMIRFLSVDQIAARLRDRFQLLAGGDRGAPERQRTLRATVDWSHELLTEAERVLLRRLTVFTGGWTLTLAEGVCSGAGVWPQDVLRLMSALVDKSLVVVDGEAGGEARYRMLNTVREYAAERLAASGEEDGLRRRHHARLAELAERVSWAISPRAKQPWPVVRRLIEGLDAMRTNGNTVLRLALAAGDHEAALRIILALRLLYLGSGRYTDIVDWLDRVLADAAAELPPGLRAQAVVFRAELALAQGDTATALAYGETGLALCRAAGERLGVASALILLATVAPRMRGPATGEVRSGTDIESRSAPRREVVEDRDGSGVSAESGVRTSVGGRGGVRRDPPVAGSSAGTDDGSDRRPRHEAACRESGTGAGVSASAEAGPDPLAEAIEIARELDDPRIEAFAYEARARLALAAGRLREARDAYRTVLGISDRLDNRWGTSRGLLGLARVAERRGDSGGARARYEQALTMIDGLDARAEIVNCVAGLGRIDLAEGACDAARRRFAEALRLSLNTGQRTGVARRLGEFARLASREGDHRRAVRLAAAAEALREAAGAGRGLRAGADLDLLLEPARKALGGPLVTVLWDSGSGMTLREAVTFALDPSAGDHAVAGPEYGARGSASLEPAPVEAASADRPADRRLKPDRSGNILTRREREVVALIARGLSNRGIAAELVISPATAARHVANILGKLGFASRTQAAAWAIERGISDRG